MLNKIYEDIKSIVGVFVFSINTILGGVGTKIALILISLLLWYSFGFVEMVKFMIVLVMLILMVAFVVISAIGRVASNKD